MKKADPISSGPIIDQGGEEQTIASHEVAIIRDGEIAERVKSGAKREHKATYAADKVNGGYLVRVIGPFANKFGGKIVPVIKRDDSESEELLDRVVWTGIDTGTPENPGTGKPVALYTFKQQSRTKETPLF